MLALISAIASVINAIVAVFELVRSEMKKRHPKNHLWISTGDFLEFGVYQLIIYKKKNLVNRRN